MATETLRPNDNGDNSECGGSDGNSTNNYQLIDESSANDADYVLSSGDGTWTLDLYNLPSTAIPAGSTISKITFYGRFKGGTNDTCKFAYKSDGTTYYSSLLTTDSSSFAERSWEQTTNQKTSAAWTIDDINALQVGVYLYGDKSKIGFCSQLWIVITYTEGGWSNIAKRNGIATADIAKINGIAVADIAKINGVAV